MVVVDDPDPSDYLAAERTYLAWMRTALGASPFRGFSPSVTAVLAVGFGAAKLSEDNRAAIALVSLVP